MDAIRYSWPWRRRPGQPAELTRRCGFTLIELMVVIGIIVVLLATFFVVGQSVITGGKERNTKAMLLLVESAINEFHAAAPLAQVGGPPGGPSQGEYVTRYGNYPPCELEVFTASGLLMPPATVVISNLTPGAAASGAAFANDVGTPEFDAVTNRDIKAMLLAIRTFSVAGSEILDRIDRRYRRTDALANSFVAPDRTIEFLDRDGSGAVNLGDTPLELLVDDWGQPIEYLSTRIVPPSGAGIPELPRQVMSDIWVRANNGVPVLMSYGGNGPDQFDLAFIDGVGPSDLVTDWTGADGTDENALDNPLNEDNVFVSEALKTKLIEGAE
ncbi:MAG: prepilin-type N-terminal cleavage/methylation domain-containing protein [Planctomycetes bacterium]|nr:prepilin-type N-terminal cleavage/methylation domain-containing protein [Planctomycetota bacterium]